MTQYDIILIHPPFSLDSSSVVSSYPKSITIRGAMMPMGMLSLAAFLEDHSFSVRIVNLGLERILTGCNIEEIIKHLEARIYAIDLHWVAHSVSAIQTAELCKKFHPESSIILGGMTASFYDTEILLGFPFIDAIVRGEAEYPIALLAERLCSGKGLDGIRGITYRIGNTLECNKPYLPHRIDDLDFVRLNLLQNWDQYLKFCGSDYDINHKSCFWLNIARGCPYECSFCGGSLSGYQLVTGRNYPVTREPKKVAEDIARLWEQGVRIVCLSHDLEVFGDEYTSSTLNWIKKKNCNISLYWESFRLPSSAFVEQAIKVFNSLEVSISLESASEEVRKKNKPNSFFTNKSLFRALDFLEKHGASTGVYFLVGLPGETLSSCRDMINMIEQIVKGKKHIWVSEIIPYTIDPHCVMAVNPKEFGVGLFFKSFKDYYEIPRFSGETYYWIGHQTNRLSRSMIADITDTVQEHINSLRQEGLASNHRFWYC
ncbi:MAG: radical SAM protein [Dehalococcoidales bacterium]|nr:radical SAM protein [Dehalococcoidales bacterium]